MDRRLESIKRTVIWLAAPASDQLAYLKSLGEDVGPDELALDFDDEYRLVGALHDEGIISNRQRDILVNLSNKLAEFSGEENSQHWTCEALTESAHWVQVRELASRFLLL